MATATIKKMASNPVTISKDNFKKIDLLFDQSLRGKSHRLYYRLSHILQHLDKMEFLFTLIPTKLVPPHLRPRVSYLIYELNTLWLLKTLKQPTHTLTNYYYSSLGYKTYYDLKNTQYQKFIVSLLEMQAVVLKDQYCAKEFLKPNSVVLDCGANIGTFSLWAHHLCPSAQIYSFEPTTNTFKILQKNVKTNKIRKFIHPFNLALGNKIKNTSILTSQDNLWDNSAISDSDFTRHNPSIKYEKKQPICMTTIDDFVKEQNLERVDLIKIDTEGYEKQIIEGARETIRKFRPVIACSAYHLPEDRKEIPKLVLKTEPNYRYRLEKRHEEVFIFWC